MTILLAAKLIGSIILAILALVAIVIHIRTYLGYRRLAHEMEEYHAKRLASLRRPSALDAYNSRPVPSTTPPKAVKPPLPPPRMIH